MTAGWLRRDGDDVLVTIRVQPRASSAGIAGEHGGALKVRLSSPPLDDAANRELIAFVAKRVRRPKSAIRIERGGRGRLKVVRIEGVGPADARARLSAG